GVEDEDKRNRSHIDRGGRFIEGRTKRVSPFAPTSHLPVASTSPPPFRNGVALAGAPRDLHAARHRRVPRPASTRRARRPTPPPRPLPPSSDRRPLPAE